MRWALRFALIAFTLRMAIGFLIGVPMPGTVLFSLPQIKLPEFLVGIRVGGDVTSQRLLSALDEALLLVALILVFAGANALSNPHIMDILINQQNIDPKNGGSAKSLR